MSTTQNGGTGAGTDPAITPDALRFCRDLITTPTLANAYYTEISTAAKNRVYETELIDNWLVKQGYQCSIEQVLLAQKQIPSYQLYYWSGGYRTLTGAAGATAAGPVVTIHAYETGAQQIGYGDQFIINPQFSNLVLTWDTSEGLNDTSGSLTFALTVAKDGTAMRSFYGQVTDASGTAQSVAGALMTSSDLQRAVDAGQATPPGQSISGVQLAMTIVNFIAQGTFIALNVVMLARAFREINALRAKVDAATTPAEREAAQSELDAAQSRSASMEQTSNAAVRQGDQAASDYAAEDPAAVEAAGAQMSDGAPDPPLDLPPNPAPASAAEQDMVSEAANEAAEAQNDPDDDPDSDDDPVSEDDEGDDIYDGIADLFEEGV
jgi:hypothetical protein